ncbi:hypothetical protein GOBAR_AA00218 [Gossypium barbadense]|uniref:RING-CH-type domain-containing protein n=1 Tax=Gossypium barbadense TaxID=3634 RepID=A0A2P5YXQ2_GOSBA|nr:hypothetical protein GOBAR_AA00218 [Gossypium barbadense]
MVDDFMVCVDKIIASAACFESSSVNEGQPISTTAAGNTNVVVPMTKASADDDSGKEGEGKTGYSSKKVKEVVECRICQEEDDLLSLEAPCACSGTLKFAHRKCIQRWCNKKGDITCEICKQVFSPNYSLPPTRSNPDVLAIDIRQTWSPHIDLRDSHLLVLTASQSQLLQSEYEDYVAANSSSLACLRLVALILLIILLVRQLLMLTRDFGMIQEASTFINVSSNRHLWIINCTIAVPQSAFACCALMLIFCIQALDTVPKKCHTYVPGSKIELEFRSAVSGFASPICWLSSADVCGGSHMVLTKPKKETG